MFNSWKAQDMIALFIIVGIIFLAFFKIDNPLTTAGAIVVGYYFGQKTGAGGSSQ
jgi:hypothetical protein